MRYLDLVRFHRRALGFGFLLLLAASFGQTFFIALFGGAIRARFGLGHGGFGTVYTVANLASGLTLMQLGRLADRVAPGRLAAAVVVAMAAAAMGMALPPHLLVLGIVIYLLRLTGQGMMLHIAVTAIARWLPRARGQALSVAGLGIPTGEAILPILAVLSLNALGLGATWALIAAVLLVVVLPLALWLPRVPPEPEAQVASTASGGTTIPLPARSWTRAEALADPRLRLLLPALVAPSFVITGIMFHQVHLVEAKGWSLAWFASSFAFYALTTVVTSLVMGRLVDRHGARRMLPFHLPVMALATLLLALFDHPGLAIALMVAGGVTSAAGMVVVNPLWAELYGLGHLGAIRAFVASMSVLAGAIAPAMLGVALDAGIAIDALVLACSLYSALSAVLVVVALARPAPAEPTG
jgi:sugar phosphate permease